MMLLAALEALLTASQGKDQPKEQQTKLQAVVVEELVTSKGKGDVEESGESDSQSEPEPEALKEEEAAAVSSPASSEKEEEEEMVMQKVMPPTPMQLCDCHGLPHAHCTGFSFRCSMCTDSFVPAAVRQFHSPNCHTNMCEDCLKDNLAFSIRNGEVKSIHCPSCGYHLLPAEVGRRVDPADLEKYHRFLLQKLLNISHNVRRCDNPGCENAVWADEECALRDWRCEGCAETCAFCKQPAHGVGRSCAASRKFRRAETRQRLWVAFSISKRCPGCKTPIIKKGGCPHMTCRNPECGHQWCWHCKGDWNNHGTCVFTKILLGGAVLLSPAIAAFFVAAAVAVGAPMLAVGGLTGTAIFDGRAIIRIGYKYVRKALRNL
jgi:hypothetical protein